MHDDMVSFEVRWSIDHRSHRAHYNDMVQARSREGAIQAIRDRCAREGWEVVQIEATAFECDLCRSWGNRAGCDCRKMAE